MNNEFNTPKAEEILRRNYLGNVQQIQEIKTDSLLLKYQQGITNYIAQFFLNLKPIDKLGHDTDIDGDGVLSAIVADEYCKQRNIPYSVQFTRGQEGIIESAKKLSKEKGITKLLVSDKHIKKDGVIKIFDENPNLSHVFVIDHHSGYYELFDLPDDIKDKFSFANISFGLKNGPAACAAMFKGATSAYMKRAERLYPHIVVGCASDDQLKFSLRYIEMEEAYENAYARGGHLNWPLNSIVGEAKAAYSTKGYADKLFEKIKKSIEQKNPCLIWEESMAEQKKIIDEVKKSNPELLNTEYKGRNLELTIYEELQRARNKTDEIDKFHVSFIKGNEASKKAEYDPKRNISEYWTVRNPTYCNCAILNYNGGISRVSIRNSIGKLILFKEGYNAKNRKNGLNYIEGHDGACGGIIETKKIPSFLDELRKYIAKVR